MIEVIEFESWAEKYFQASLHSWRDPAWMEPNRGAPKSRLREIEKLKETAYSKWLVRRDHAIATWEAAKIAGFVREPTHLESLLETAQGMDELRATQAARRILKKYYNIDWETYQMVPENVTPSVGTDFREDKWAFAQKFLPFLKPEHKQQIVEDYQRYQVYGHDKGVLGASLSGVWLVRLAVAAFIVQDEDGTAGREYNDTTAIWRTKNNVDSADRQLEFMILEAVLEEKGVAHR